MALFKEGLTQLGGTFKELGTGAVQGVARVGTGIKDKIQKEVTDVTLGIGLRAALMNDGALRAAMRAEGAPSTRRRITTNEAEDESQLKNINQEYFEPEFDSVRHELTNLSDEQLEQLDMVVDRLASGVEIVSGRLARHIVRKRDQLVTGVNTVASVEDDVKAAYASIQSGRALVRSAADDITRSMRVAGQARRKHAYIELAQVCLTVKRARDLQISLRKAQESGEYGQAIILCVQCFQGMDSLKGLAVASDLLAGVQRMYVETLQRIDGALTMLCSEFNAERYVKVLEAFALQGATAELLQGKMQQCFSDSIADVTLRTLKSLLLTSAQSSDPAAGLALVNGNYAELYSRVPPDMLGACATRLMEMVSGVLVSVHQMIQWHTGVVAEHAATAGEAQQQQQGQEQQGDDFMGLVTGLSNVLSGSRLEVVRAATRRLLELFNHPAINRSDVFSGVLSAWHTFCAVAESFMGRPLPELRSVVSERAAPIFDAAHQADMNQLKEMLSTETWAPIPVPPHLLPQPLGSSISHHHLISSPFGALRSGGDGSSMGGAPGGSSSGAGSAVPDFDLLIEAGNPYTVLQQGGGALLRSASSSGSISSPARAPSMSAASAAAAAAEGAAGSTGVITASCERALTLLHNYCSNLKALPTQRGVVWAAMNRVFDEYLLAEFIRLGGIGLDNLVMEPHVVTPRLHSALIRIMSAPHNPFRPQLEELLRQRANSPRDHPSSASHVGGLGGMGGGASAATGISWLDRFGTKMERLASDLDKSVAKAMQQAAAAQGAAAGVGGAAGGARGGQEPPQAGTRGMAERITSGEALLLLSRSVQALRPTLHAALQHTSGATSTTASSSGAASGQQQQLQPGVSSVPCPTFREVEGYLSGTVGAAADLRDCLMRSAARSFLQHMVEPQQGIAAQVAATNYAVSSPSAYPHSWAYDVATAMSGFHDMVHVKLRMAPGVSKELWQVGVELCCDALLDGLARVKKCSLEGRASMTLDVSHVAKALQQAESGGSSSGQQAAASPLPGSASPGGSVALHAGGIHAVDAYVRAYYLPWADFTKWAQVNSALYKRPVLLALCQAVADHAKPGRGQLQMLVRELEDIGAFKPGM